MRERRQIVDLWHRGQASALATLICVEGSSYRRPGARLLIAANGEYAGAISGGCLEAEVIRKAQWMVRNGAVVERYSTLFDDTADIPYGLGCGGTVDVLLEPANTPEFTALLQALEASLHGASFQIETHLPTSTTPLRRTIQTRDSLATGLPLAQPQTFVETLTPPQRLIVIGAGDDAQPLVQMAALLGWRTVVLDGRSQWARPDRFPQAEQVLTLDPLEGARLVAQDFSPGSACHNPDPKNGALAPGLQIDEHDAIVLMTHSYEQDRAWLATLLPLHPRYLGLLGARHRSALLVAEAASLLRWPVERACAELFAPVGLDLGGDGAESIALAVIAEIKARVEGKIGHSRRMTADMVAEQIAQGGSSRYLQTQCAI